MIQEPTSRRHWLAFLLGGTSAAAMTAAFAPVLPAAGAAGGAARPPAPDAPQTEAGALEVSSVMGQYPDSSGDVDLTVPLDDEVPPRVATAVGPSGSAGQRVRVEEAPLSLRDPRVGGVGDGVADDTAAIDAAIDLLPAGGALYVPPGGRYLTGGGHVVDKPCTIIGPSGRAQPHNTNAQLRLRNGANKDLLTVSSSQVTIRDLTLSGNYTNQSGASSGLVVNSGSNYLLLDAVWVESFNGSGIKFAGAPSTISGTVVNSESRLNQGYGIEVGPAATDLIISDSYIDQNALAGIYCTAGDLSVTSCHIWGNGTSADAALGKLDGIYFQSSTGCRIVNCYIETNRYGAGIRYGTGTMRGHLVQGCDIWANGLQAIYAYSLTDSTFTGNLIHGNSQSGSHGGIHLDTCARILTANNNFFNGGGAPRQTYGYIESGETCVDCLLTGNLAKASQHVTGSWLVGADTTVANNVG